MTKSSELRTDSRLEVNAAQQRASLYTLGRLQKTYTVSTSSIGLGCTENSNCTPHGSFAICEKIGTDLPLGAVLDSRQPTGEITREWQNQSSQDLVLSRILWLDGIEPHNRNTKERYIYLHGTNQEHLLCSKASHGCIRFSNYDIAEVYELLNVGDLVEISP
jgi:lipoprotein-anchoring transpeptidase ErfK/SrfK